MKTHPCCQREVHAGNSKLPRTSSHLKRGGEVAGWILPSMTLALLPKCPACVAAYVALATGIGISLPAAACLRWGMLILCVACLVFIVFIAARRVSRWAGQRR